MTGHLIGQDHSCKGPHVGQLYREVDQLDLVHECELFIISKKTDPGYRTVSGHLRLMAARSGTSIGGRWDTEAKVNAGT
jgi:hypothetical protein